MTIQNNCAPESGLSPSSLAELLEALAFLDNRYDEPASMLSTEVGAIRYHTKLKQGSLVHPTRESAEYASALFETGVPWRIRRGVDILRVLLDLQDTDESSRTYGIWSWFKEEPLDSMSPPDWNWADFIGVQLAQILWRSGTHLDFELRNRVESALRHAARSIIRRDVTMRYTNIAIMGGYVTVMAGAILNDGEILDYGRKRLRRFHTFTTEWGGFPEYNSPNYTVVALMEFTRMLRDFTREDDRLVVRELHDQVWREIAVHWHAFSGQWSGPHSRSYQTILSPELLGILDRGLRPRLSIQENHPPALQEILLPLRCPDEYLPYFSGEQPSGTRRQRILEGEPVLEGVSYLADEFALSSVERGTFWNQSRALTAYSRNGDGPTAWHVRFLRDGYDYSSANIISAQKDAAILGALCFAKDGGNVHCSLDPIRDARIEASDWRLRLQCHGSVRLPEIPGDFSTQQVLDFELADGVVLSVRIPWLSFGGFIPHWATPPDDSAGGVDLVLYSGPARPFVFDSGFPCALGLAITVNHAAALEQVHAGLIENRLQLEWPLPQGDELQIAGPLFALSEREITDFAREVKRGGAARMVPIRKNYTTE